MRRLCGWLIGWGLICGLVAAPSPAAWGQMLAPPAPGTLRIGVAAAVQGAVQIATPGAVGRIAASGQPIYLGDLVTTDARSHLQILLLDETVFTIGPNSAIAIDEFVYDPASHAGKVSARVVKGVFRFVTGKVARRNPRDMEVKLPVGVIGIRGTMAAGRIDGDRAQVILLGPGPRNNTGDPPGQVTVGTEVDGVFQEVALTRPGFGTVIPGTGQAPTRPAPVPASELAALASDLAPEAPAEGGGAKGEPSGAAEGSPTAMAGQDTVQGLKNFGGVDAVADLSADLAKTSTQTSQGASKDAATIADGIATKEQLRTIETGVFHYQYQGGAGSFVQTKYVGSPSSYQGTVTAAINIDFGARTIGGGASHVLINTSSFGGNIYRDETIEAQSFATGAGNAVFGDTSTDGYISGSLTLKNVGGTVAAQGEGSVTYDDGGSNVGSSGTIAMTREAGAAS